MKNHSINRVLYTVLILNCFLAIIKIIVGITGGSSSLTNDGINSATDVILSIILIIIVRISSKAPDENHPYGHEKFEAVLSLIVGLMIITTGVLISYETVFNIIKYSKGENNFTTPSFYTLMIAVVSVIIKIFLFVYTRKMSKVHEQMVLMADSINHFADAISTVFVVIGIFLSIIGFHVADYVASLIISVVIIISGTSVFIDSINLLVDKAPSPIVIKEIEDYIRTVQGVLGIDDIKIRRHVSKLYVDVEIVVTGSLSLIYAHKIAETVHLGVEEEFLNVIHCMVHVNPNERIMTKHELKRYKK